VVLPRSVPSIPRFNRTQLADIFETANIRNHMNETLRQKINDLRVSFYTGRWENFRYDERTLKTAREELCRIFRASQHLSKILPDEVYLLTQSDLQTCIRSQEALRHGVINKDYCHDALSLFTTGIGVKFIISSFGDKTADNVSLPVILKARKGTESIERSNGILWPLNINRHYAPIGEVSSQDIAWQHKNNRLVWRGTDTGFENERFDQVQKYFNSIGDNIDIAFSPYVLNPESRRFSRPWITMGALLRSKYLLSLDGNDVSSGLKWMLYSNSVVLMPPPRYETWGMETLLKPYLHYIPLHRNLSNLREQLAWARDNDDKCQHISRQATAFVKFLFNSTENRIFHDITIKRRVMSTYNRVISHIMSGWSNLTMLCHKSD